MWKETKARIGLVKNFIKLAWLAATTNSVLFSYTYFKANLEEVQKLKSERLLD